MIGVAVALTSRGAGAIGAACLALLYPELEPAEIAGSDIAHAVPLTAVAAAGHLWLGTIDPGLLLALLTGGIPGIVQLGVAPCAYPRAARDADGDARTCGGKAPRLTRPRGDRLVRLP